MSADIDTADAGDTTNAEGEQASSGFQAITSQEELDRIVGKRVIQERKRYHDYDDVKARAEIGRAHD